MDNGNNSGFDLDDDFGWGDDGQGMDDSEYMNNSGFANYHGPSNQFGSFNPKRGRGNFGPGRGNGGHPPFFGPPRPMRPMPFGPPGGPPPFMWGRGFGPSGPPIRKPSDDKALRYLMRCGVAKENLKNLPRDLLQVIEPQYCGICAQSFDSFHTSRLHYISKNHLKSQKKWVTQQPNGGLRRQREVPLKSRDLYCELCDVHITSKVHAESHYSGKPHRAIVEGRKSAKNPFLLQKGMENRVEQLIRREKKHLKPVAEAIEEAQESAKEIKAIQPELYCEICKTTVTCTEQMTMHLNGKRHLTKEKLHILKMMKGEVNTDNKADANQSAGETDSTTKDAESAETATAETPADAPEEDWAGQW